jgi:hypothetical protein
VRAQNAQRIAPPIRRGCGKPPFFSMSQTGKAIARAIAGQFSRDSSAKEASNA